MSEGRAMGEGVGVPLENAEKLGNRGSSKIMPTRNPGGSVGSIFPHIYLVCSFSYCLICFSSYIRDEVGSGSTGILHKTASIFPHSSK